MLTLSNSPEAIAFSRNPVQFRIRATDGSDPYGARGASAWVSMNTNGMLVDDTLTVEWDEPDGSFNSLTFTAKANPVQDLWVQAQPSGLGDFAYFQAVADKIQAHPVISAFFTLAVDTPVAGVYRITFTANNTSSGFSVELDISGIDSGSTPATVATAAVADNTPDNYSVLLDVFFEAEYESDTYEIIAELSGKPDADGYVLFDLQSVIHSHARKSFSTSDLPDLTATPDITTINNIRRYYVRYREDYDGIYDDPMNTDGVWIYTSELKVMMGGISQMLWSGIDFFGDMDATNSLLTWYPDKKTVSPAQPEYLPWFNFNTVLAKSLVLQVRRYTESSTLSTVFIYETSAEVPKQTAAMIPVGYSQLVAAGVNMDNVVKYTVRIVDESSDWEGGSPTFLSPLRTYYVDNSRYEELRYIIYLNSFYCPLTVRCTGNLSKDLEVDPEDSTRIIPRGYDDSFAQNFTHAADWDNVRSYRTGYIKKQEADALQELLIYRMAWEIRASGYAALFLLDKKFKITETFQFLHSVEIKATRALKPVNYSGQVAVDLNTAEFWELEDSGLFELENATGFWKLETT